MSAVCETWWWHHPFDPLACMRSCSLGEHCKADMCHTTPTIHFWGGKSWRAQCTEIQGLTLSLLSPHPHSLVTRGGAALHPLREVGSSQSFLGEPESLNQQAGAAVHMLEAWSWRFWSAFPKEMGLYDKCSSTLASNDHSWALWGAGTRASKGEPAWASALQALVCICSQPDTHRAGQERRHYPIKPLENFKWQRGMLHQPPSWRTFQLVIAFYCKARTVSKSHKSTEKTGCTEAEGSFYTLD